MRSVHAATVEAGLTAAQKEQLNVIALEGNPGIGKTTAVVSFLKQQAEGFLFLYASPRVVINRDVTHKLAREDNKPTGILTLTTNAKLIGFAEKYNRQNLSATREKDSQFKSDRGSDKNKGLVRNAMELVEAQFGNLDLLGRPLSTKSSQNPPISYSEYQTLERLTKYISRPSSRLLPNLNDRVGIIPENISCIGAFWLEHWCDCSIQEKYNFSQRHHKSLISLLYQMSKQQGVPRKLRNLALDLHQLLNEEQTEEMREYSTLQDMNTRTFAIALPLDYPHFLREEKDSEECSRKQELEDPQIWYDALARSLIARGTALPAIPRYKRFPWAAVAGRPVLSQIDTVFDNRYFMISNELNLLNTILLEDVEERSLRSRSR
ncbi:MAG: hypothetical protein AB4290_17770 [Spirulina sp.]